MSFTQRAPLLECWRTAQRYSAFQISASTDAKAAAAPLHRLHAKIPDHKPARHGSPDPPGTSRTSLARQVNRAVTLPGGGSPDVADTRGAGR